MLLSIVATNEFLGKILLCISDAAFEYDVNFCFKIITTLTSEILTLVMKMSPTDFFQAFPGYTWSEIKTILSKLQQKPESMIYVRNATASEKQVYFVYLVQSFLKNEQTDLKKAAGKFCEKLEKEISISSTEKQPENIADSETPHCSYDYKLKSRPNTERSYSSDDDSSTDIPQSSNLSKNEKSKNENPVVAKFDDSKLNENSFDAFASSSKRSFASETQSGNTKGEVIANSISSSLDQNFESSSNNSDGTATKSLVLEKPKKLPSKLRKLSFKKTSVEKSDLANNTVTKLPTETKNAFPRSILKKSKAHSAIDKSEQTNKGSLDHMKQNQQANDMRHVRFDDNVTEFLVTPKNSDFYLKLPTDDSLNPCDEPPTKQQIESSTDNITTSYSCVDEALEQELPSLLLQTKTAEESSVKASDIDETDFPFVDLPSNDLSDELNPICSNILPTSKKANSEITAQLPTPVSSYKDCYSIEYQAASRAKYSSERNTPCHLEEIFDQQIDAIPEEYEYTSSSFLTKQEETEYNEISKLDEKDFWLNA